MPRKPKTVKLKKENRLLASNEIVPVYSNSVHLQISNYDIRFSFGEVVEAGETGTTTLERARIFMTVEHSKAFLHVLKDNIEKYEQKFGKVRWPVKPKS